VAEYGAENQEPAKPTGPQPLFKKPAGLGIAMSGGLAAGLMAGGLPGGLIGVIASPVALWLFGKKGPTIAKDKKGKEIKVGVWAQWITAGVFAYPAVMIVGVALGTGPRGTEQSTKEDSPSQVYLETQKEPDAATAAVTAALVAAKQRETPFTPGVPGRYRSEVCNTTSEACQLWTALTFGCEENQKRRDAGYLGKFERGYCNEAEALRQKLTGVALSTSPGAYDF